MASRPASIQTLPVDVVMEIALCSSSPVNTALLFESLCTSFHADISSYNLFWKRVCEDTFEPKTVLSALPQDRTVATVWKEVYRSSLLIFLNEKARREVAFTFHLYTAKKSPYAVILLKYGRRKWRMVSWNRDTNEVVRGQWLMESIRPKECELSPTGSMFIYSYVDVELNINHAHTCVSAPPFFTALCYLYGGKWRNHGGGTWTTDTEFVFHEDSGVGYIGDRGNICRIPDGLKYTKEPQFMNHRPDHITSRQHPRFPNCYLDTSYRRMVYRVGESIFLRSLDNDADTLESYSETEAEVRDQPEEIAYFHVTVRETDQLLCNFDGEGFANIPYPSKSLNTASIVKGGTPAISIRKTFSGFRGRLYVDQNDMRDTLKRLG
eukprot:TRINITY_DN2978_c0_g1_i1.p1 TRINITY_DN2978_c0_g1~~TRINITY_DN2978_c0_g1_i1.p1  ORF type:complete len:380 (+),score=41.24 TRINITY_DN2978_c0_g1_i1:49-1188(+)